MLIEEYFFSLTDQLAQKTANREAGMVKAADRYAVRLGTLTKSPAEYAKAPPSRRPSPTPTRMASFG